METPIRQFGQRHENVPYSLRPGAYVVIGNAAGQVALVQTPEGYFLPGGGQDEGESACDAALREVQEEVGLSITLDGEIGVADQLVFAADEQHHYQKRCHFFGAKLEAAQPSIESGEPDHKLLWLEPAKAVAQLRHASQRWAVARWRQMSFWRQFLQSGVDAPRAMLAESATDMPEAWGFGDGPEMADELGQLVYAGVKTATCSALWEYEYDGEALPQVGSLDIVLDGAELPLCVIETVDVQIRPYNQVDADFAHAEGEGDRTLAWWRRAHWEFFTRVLPRIGRTPQETMPLVCEQFQVLFRA